MMLNAHALSLGSQKSAHECVAIRRRRPPRASSPHRPERGNSGACGPRLPGKEDHVAQLCQVRVFPFRLQLFVPVHGRFSVRALKVIADYAFFRVRSSPQWRASRSWSTARAASMRTRGCRPGCVNPSPHDTAICAMFAELGGIARVMGALDARWMC